MARTWNTASDEVHGNGVNPGVDLYHMAPLHRLVEEQMNTELTPADVLERAADGFESGRYGWIQGISHRRMRDGTDRYCSTGALHYEAGLRELEQYQEPERSLRIRVYRDADRALEKTIEFDGHGGVAGWNDHKAENLAEVIEKMKEAAKNLRNKEEAR